MQRGGEPPLERVLAGSRHHEEQPDGGLDAVQDTGEAIKELGRRKRGRYRRALLVSRSHPTSREVRGIDATTTVKWLLLGFVYLVMAVFGALGLVALAQGDLDEAGGLVSCVIALVGGAGLSWSVNRLWARRHRRGAVLGTAPSGRPAVVIRRGAFMVIGSTIFTALAAMLLIVVALGGGSAPVVSTSLRTGSSTGMTRCPGLWSGRRSGERCPGCRSRCRSRME